MNDLLIDFKDLMCSTRHNKSISIKNINIIFKDDKTIKLFREILKEMMEKKGVSVYEQLEEM